MDEISLDEMLRHRRLANGASLPLNFEQNVWRAIRARSADGRERAGSVWQWLFGPQMVTAMLTVAITVGVGLGSRLTDHGASNARNALNLNVFTDRAPALPSTLLASDL